MTVAVLSAMESPRGVSATRAVYLGLVSDDSSWLSSTGHSVVCIFPIYLTPYAAERFLFFILARFFVRTVTFLFGVVPPSAGFLSADTCCRRFKGWGYV